MIRARTILVSGAALAMAAGIGGRPAAAAGASRAQQDGQSRCMLNALGNPPGFVPRTEVDGEGTIRTFISGSTRAAVIALPAGETEAVAEIYTNDGAHYLVTKNYTGPRNPIFLPHGIDNQPTLRPERVLDAAGQMNRCAHLNRIR